MVLHKVGKTVVCEASHIYVEILVKMVERKDHFVFFVK